MKNTSPVPSLVSVLEQRIVWPPPVWMMRQAGRYLPEYQAVRKRVGSFWNMCMTPEFAEQVTLQPIERFNLDAAILFSDILVVPYALGQSVRFEEGVGPVLEQFRGEERLEDDATVWEKRLAPVYAAMRGSRSRLESGKALIGFAGAPWTLAAYMIEGKGSPDQRAAKLFGYREPERFAGLLARIADAVSFHLVRQLEEGADVVQIFDSWAGGLADHEFEQWVIKPTVEVVCNLRRRYADARIIGFPRAVTESQYQRYASVTGVDCVSIDTATSVAWAAKEVGKRCAIQGNLDPVALIAGGEALDKAVDRILADGRSVPHIFNLGHGVLPETPPDNVAQVVARVRGAA